MRCSFVGGMTPGRVTQGKQFTKAEITDLMVADLIKAELITRRSEAGQTDHIGGPQLGARADRPPFRNSSVKRSMITSDLNSRPDS